MKQTDVTVTFYLKKSEMNDEGDRKSTRLNSSHSV